jgi:NADPH:quinone reductase
MATNATRAVVVDTTAPQKLVIREVPLGPPLPGNVAVRVTAISLNRGETKRALTQSETGWRPGWDFAGVVETAADAGGPPKGARVVGMLPAGAWAERQCKPWRRCPTASAMRRPRHCPSPG